MQEKSKNFRYGMKAAPLYSEQLVDRISKFKKLLMDPIIELHLFGSKDIFSHDSIKICIDNCQYLDAELYVHFPILDLNGYGVYDPAKHPDSYFETVLGFSKKIKAKAIIMHRAYSIGMALPKDIANSCFNEKIMHWANMAYPMQIYVENYSFIWLPKGFKQEFVLSPLDHFFPWEIKEFMRYTEDRKIKNVSAIIDIAHAAISSNMFNLVKYNKIRKKDHRFDNIFSEDLCKSNFLKPQDFLINGIAPYLHLSDTFMFSDPYNINYPIDDYLMREGLPIGSGNLDFEQILDNVAEQTIFVMEINPLDANHANNYAQYQGIEYFAHLTDKIKDRY